MGWESLARKGCALALSTLVSFGARAGAAELSAAGAAARRVAGKIRAAVWGASEIAAGVTGSAAHLVAGGKRGRSAGDWALAGSAQARRG